MASAIRLPVLAVVALTGLNISDPARAQQAVMSFFVTSAGTGDGADLGGLAGPTRTARRSPNPRGRQKPTGTPI